MHNLAESLQWLFNQQDERQMNIIKHFLDNLSDGFGILDKDLNYLFVNKTILKRSNATESDYIGKNILDVYPSLRGTSRPEAYRNVIKTGITKTFELASTNEEPYFLNITAFKINDGLGILTDDRTHDISFENTILELHRHANMLQEAKNIDEVYEITLDVMESVLGFGTFDILVPQGDRLMQVLAQNLPIGTGVPLDTNGITIRAFKQKVTMLVNDLTQDEGYYKIRNPETNEIFSDFPESRSELATPILLDGKTIGILNVESPELNKFNYQQAVFLEILAIQVAGAIKRINDLNRIYEQETQFTQFADNSYDAVCFYLFNHGFTYVNATMEKLFGYSKKHIMKDPNFLVNSVVPEDRHILDALFEEAQKGILQTTRLMLRVKNSNNELLTINGWVSPLQGTDKKIIGFYGSARDITQNIRHENNLRALNEHAANLATSKSIYEISTTTLNILKTLLQSEFGSFQIVENDELRTLNTISHPSGNPM